MPQQALPVSDITTGGWLPKPIYQQINNPQNNDVTLVTSSSNPVNDTFEVALPSTLQWPQEGDQVLTVRLRQTASGTTSVYILLLQGSRTIAIFSLQPTTSFEDYFFTLTAQEVSSITDYTNLRLEVIAGATYLLLDTFTDTNGTALTNHTMDIGPGWATAYSGGTWTISNNQATQTANGGSGGAGYMVVSNAGSTATNAGTYCSVQVQTDSSGNNNGTLVGWASSNGVTRYQWAISYYPGNSTIALLNNGVQVASANFTFARNTAYALKMLWDGTHINCYVNGSLLVTYTPSSGPTNTYFGLYEYRSTGFWTGASLYDNFMVNN